MNSPVKKIALVLSGCGFKDGSEITESVSTLIALSQKGAQYKAFAPDINYTSTNHITGESEGTRNTIAESARITRGEVADIKSLKACDFDALVFPGGFGAAIHLCSWAQKGNLCEVHPEVDRVIRDFYNSSSPIGAVCIAPALVARVLGPLGIIVTIGNDNETAAEIEKTGATHEVCPVDDYITDRENKIITTPAYMYEATPAQVFKGITGLVQELYEMA